MTRPDRLVLVVGTGTEVGKTWVTCRLIEELRSQGRRVEARKPAQSFNPEPPPAAPTDAALLAAATGEPVDRVTPPHRNYPRAMAPPMAAEFLGLPAFTVAYLAGEIQWGTDKIDVGFVETAGGLRSPQATDGDALDLARLVDPDAVLLVADAGLGTINAVRLAVDALGHAGINSEPTTAVVLNRYDAANDLHRRNRQWLAERDGLPVLTTPTDLTALAAAVVVKR